VGPTVAGSEEEGEGDDSDAELNPMHDEDGPDDIDGGGLHVPIGALKVQEDDEKIDGGVVDEVAEMLVEADTGETNGGEGEEKDKGRNEEVESAIADFGELGEMAIMAMADGENARENLREKEGNDHEMLGDVAFDTVKECGLPPIVMGSTAGRGWCGHGDVDRRDS
jgi:hypothetical protein